MTPVRKSPALKTFSFALTREGGLLIAVVEVRRNNKRKADGDLYVFLILQTATQQFVSL